MFTLPAEHPLILFYPCSGQDWIVPIQLFAPFVDEFWFVDTGYFQINSAECARPVLSDVGYELLDVQIEGLPLARMERRDGKPYLEPCVRSEYYEHFITHDVIAVHRRRGYAVHFMQHYLPQFDVFFYRGDDWQREHGSQLFWLSTRKHGLIEEVLDHLSDGGLLVTDGSNCKRSRNPYAPLAQFREDYRGLEAAKLAQPFETLRARFECVGYAGYRYGPTLIWQVRKQHQPLLD